MALTVAKIKPLHISAAVMICAAAIAGLLILTQSKLLSVQSGSMAPSINKGNLILISETSTDSIVPGDVVTYINPEDSRQTITHRVLATPSFATDNQFIMKGDANNVADQAIPANYIVGKQQIINLPYLGHVLDFLRTPLGLVAVIYIPALLLIATEVGRMKDYFRAMQPYYASEAVRRQLENRRLVARQHRFSNRIKRLTVFNLLTAVFMITQLYL